MEVVNEARKLSGVVISHALSSMRATHYVTVYLSNGSHSTLERGATVGEVACSAGSLPEGYAAEIRFTNSGGAVEFRLADGQRFLVVARNPRGGLAALVVRFTSDDTLTVAAAHKQLHSGFFGAPGERSCVQGQSYAAALNHVRLGSSSVAHVLLANSSDVCEKVGKPVFGTRFAMEGLDQGQLVKVAETCVRRNQLQTLGAAVFLTEFTAILPHLEDLRWRDRMFAVDILIHTFVLSGMIDAQLCAATLSAIQNWRASAPPAVAEAEIFSYDTYSSLNVNSTSADVHAVYVDAAMIVLKTTVLRCYAHLQDVDVRPVRTDRCIGKSLTEASGFSENTYDTNSTILQKHLSYSDVPSVRTSEGSNHAHGNDDEEKEHAAASLMTLIIRQTITDSAEFSLRRIRVVDHLHGLLSGEAQKALRYYRDWVPATSRVFKRSGDSFGKGVARLIEMTGGKERRKKRCPCVCWKGKKSHDKGQPFFWCKSLGSEIFAGLDGRETANPQLVLDSLGRNSPPYMALRTNSKSGEVFLFSADRRFLIKTISEDEALILLKMLPEYQRHIRLLPTSTIVRYAGLYCVHVAGRAPMYFTVMASIFDPEYEIQFIFDVKGSTHKRKKKELETIGKDQDWIESGIRMDIPDVARAKFCAAHEEDAAFLEAFNVMDYSILIGVHRLASEPKDSEQPSKKGILAVDGKTLYFVGIIDFLIGYYLKKQAEHLLNTVQGHGEDASCVDPKQYARRQVRFVRDQVVRDRAAAQKAQVLPAAGTRGSLQIRGMSAKQLRNADFLGKSDPYLQVVLGLQTVRTEVVWNNTNPTWTRELSIPVDERHLGLDLLVECWDEDNKALQGAGDFLGKVVIPMANIIEATAQPSGVLELLEERLHGVKTGTLSATFQFVALDLVANGQAAATARPATPTSTVPEEDKFVIQPSMPCPKLLSL